MSSSDKKLYEIWHVTDRICYVLKKYLSVLPWTRDEVISTDLEKLRRNCQRMNACACEDEEYIIREVDPKIFDYFG
jgi:hypothetical protein